MREIQADSTPPAAGAAIAGSRRPVLDPAVDIDARSQSATRAPPYRFLTDSNSLYVAGLASADRPARKDLVGGGQAGYSRRHQHPGNADRLAVLSHPRDMA